MNIFYLDSDVKLCAQYHNNKHVIKQILEYAQLLSTTHRVLDGKETISIKNGRKKKEYILDEPLNINLYSATHINHPSAIWTRKCASNYRWLYELWLELMDEYTYRYGKNHKCEFLIPYLCNLPKNISTLEKFTEPTPAMPEQYINKEDSITSYRKYYLGAKLHLAAWKKRNIPEWFIKSSLEELSNTAQTIGLYNGN